MPWLIPLIESLGSSTLGTVGLGTAAASPVASAAAGTAELAKAASAKLIPTLAASAAKTAAPATSFGSGLIGAGEQYMSPLINAYHKTVSDFHNPNVGIIGRGMDIANTAGQFKDMVHGQGGEVTNAGPQQQPPIPPDRDAVLKAYLATHPEQNTNN